jgi:hypothetical protein
VAALRISARLSGVIASRVSRAFDKTNLRNAGEPPKILRVENQRPFDEAMNQQFVSLWIDLRNPCGMPLKMKSGRRDDAVEILQRSATRSGARRDGLAEKSC